MHRVLPYFIYSLLIPNRFTSFCLAVPTGLSFQPKSILIIIPHSIAVSIGFAVLVFEGIGHIAIFVVTGHIVGADANAVGVHGQHGIPAGQGEGQLAGGGKTAKNHIQRSRTVGVKPGQQHIAQRLYIAQLPGQRYVHIGDDLAAVCVYRCGNLRQPFSPMQRGFCVGVGLP